MSSKTNKTINSAFGIPGPVVKVDFTATASASGLLYPESVYRFDTSEDCTLRLLDDNDGRCDTTLGMTLFAGVPEMMSTPSLLDGGETRQVDVLCSGLTATGMLHCTLMNTRGT
jgi:hypothetical protein